MITPSQIEYQLEKILPRIQKPGRYVGGEWNTVRKNWESVPLHIALVFPDLYDIGVPNLGLAILYDLINSRTDALAERSFAPWVDMEKEMRQAALPLYSLESKHPLAAFDIIGFSLPYETLYTNTLNILDLAGIPLRSSHRTEQHPLIIAGGHACFNPEPMHAFIDAFVIGEGEDIIHEILDVYHHWKSTKNSRHQLLHNLSQISGVYIPSFYSAQYDVRGYFSRLDANESSIPSNIQKRIVPTLPPPTTRFIVPNINVVHNRVAIEVMRGCTRGCRFCHAGMIMRPVRERTVEDILTAIENALNSTGYEEVALLSLSSSDYTKIVELIESINQHFQGKHLAVSLPSLRIESFSVDIMEQLRGSRFGGFTLAPEAATDRMRSIINKPVSTEQLLETAHAIYSRGWVTLKLYFMIGHPSETPADVQAIVDLCRQVITVGRKTIGGRARLNVGVSTFIPKPHTPFQWVACDSMEQIVEKQNILRSGLRDRNIKLTWTAPEETHLEAWLSRGDRRLADVIETAHKLGAKFDAWQDQFQYSLWLQAFAENNMVPNFITHRTRNVDEPLPWDHIHTGVHKQYLIEEYLRSQRSELREDCREGCHACGILPDYALLRSEFPGPLWLCPEVKPQQKRRKAVTAEE